MTKAICVSCQICGKEGQADLLCTTILLDNQKEQSCWCVCSDCQPTFQEKIHGYYQDIVD
ncbi:MAG: hypothetical protein SCK28_04945 [Bacillota bacterium]|nr:hypothetical protein [Bacillota bacterium]